MKLYGVIKFMKYGKTDSLGPFVGVGKIVCAVAQRNIAFGVRTSGPVYGDFFFVVTTTSVGKLLEETCFNVII